LGNKIKKGHSGDKKLKGYTHVKNFGVADWGGLGKSGRCGT
jgi:hypothetical protein